MFLSDFITGIEFTAVNGVLAHIIGEAIPRKIFNGNSFPFKSAKWEREGQVYNRVHISKWMRKMPDMSKIIPYMFRKKIDGQMDTGSLRHFIEETCVAEATHVVLILTSPILTTLVDGSTGVFFMFLYSFCNLPFAIIQRYNRPKLMKIYERQLLRENTENKEIRSCESFNTVV